MVCKVVLLIYLPIFGKLLPRDSPVVRLPLPVCTDQFEGVPQQGPGNCRDVSRLDKKRLRGPVGCRVCEASQTLLDFPL
jgi:hypothetical protein